MQLLLAAVPPHVRSPGGHHLDLAGPHGFLFPVDMQAEHPRQDLEALLLHWVDVLGSNKPSRRHVEIRLQELSPGVPGDLSPDQPLPRDGMLEYVAGFRHWPTSWIDA